MTWIFNISSPKVRIVYQFLDIPSNFVRFIMCGILYSTENLLHCPFREKCLYLEEFSGPYFPAFWTEYGEIRSIFQYLVLNEGENLDQKNSKYGHFSRSGYLSLFLTHILCQNPLRPSEEVGFPVNSRSTERMQW